MTGGGGQSVARPWWVPMLLVIAALVTASPVVFATYAATTTEGPISTPTTPTVPQRTTTTKPDGPSINREVVERARRRNALAVFQDDFTDPTSGWPTGEQRDGTSAEFVDGGYSLSAPDGVAHADTPFGRVRHQVAVSATASMPPDAADGTGVGVACTYSPDGGRPPTEAISFEVFAEGRFRLGTWGAGPNELLANGPIGVIGAAPVVTLLCADMGTIGGLSVVGFVDGIMVVEHTIVQDPQDVYWTTALLAEGPSTARFTDVTVQLPSVPAPDAVPPVDAAGGTVVVDHDLHDPSLGWTMHEADSQGFASRIGPDGVVLDSGRFGGWLEDQSGLGAPAVLASVTVSVPSTPPGASAGVGCRHEDLAGAWVQPWLVVSPDGRWSLHLSSADSRSAPTEQVSLRSGAIAPLSAGVASTVRLACVPLPPSPTGGASAMDAAHVVGFVGEQQVVDVLIAVPRRDAVSWRATLEVGDADEGEFSATFSRLEVRSIAP